GLDGMLSYTVLVPGEDLGFVILTNSESPAFSIMMQKIRDVFLDAPERDYNALSLANRRRAQERTAKQIADEDAERVAGTRPSLALGKYAGTYRDQLYGDITVAEEGGRMVMRFGASPNFVADLEHWHYDTFQ